MGALRSRNCLVMVPDSIIMTSASIPISLAFDERIWAVSTRQRVVASAQISVLMPFGYLPLAFASATAAFALSRSRLYHCLTSASGRVHGVTVGLIGPVGSPCPAVAIFTAASRSNAQ